MEFSVEQVAELLGGSFEGNGEAKLTGLSKIEEGQPSTLSFLSNPAYEKYIYQTTSTAVIVDDSFEPTESLPETLSLIKVENARAAFGKLLEAYQGFKAMAFQGQHASAIIDESAQVDESVYVGPNVVIMAGAKIAAGCQIHANTIVGTNATIGEASVIYNNVVVHEESVVGKKCIIQHGAVIGGDGFGFVPNSENNYSKIVHIGNVILEDYVEVGANTCIDRATLGSTIIRKGAKLDNLIQIGHNVDIGENTVIAGQTGVAGSMKIGKNCMIGGQVGFSGHFEVPDNMKFAAQSGVQKGNYKEGDILQGSPAFEIGQYKRSYVMYRSLPKFKATLNDLEREVKRLKEELASK